MTTHPELSPTDVQPFGGDDYTQARATLDARRAAAPWYAIGRRRRAYDREAYWRSENARSLGLAPTRPAGLRPGSPTHLAGAGFWIAMAIVGLPSAVLAFISALAG